MRADGIQYDELKEIAGVSADDILEEAYKLLKDRKWNSVTKNGIKANMIKWLNNKGHLIREMVKNPCYNGNLQLVVPAAIRRMTAHKDAQNCLSKIIRCIEAQEDRTINKDGKTASDYIKEICNNASGVADPNNIEGNSLVNILADFAKEFYDNLTSVYTCNRINKICDALKVIKYSCTPRIEDLATDLNSTFNFKTKKITPEQKTSKVVSRILHMTQNYDRYNKLFTEFSDMINEGTQKGYFVISLNFLDYLRSSDGNSWSSCHTTDFTNTRGMDSTYSGAHCQGCLSYANDCVTLVTYFVDEKADTKHTDRSWKIYRTLFHLNPNMKTYIEGRVYPQGNDGVRDIYGIMNDLFCQTMGIENAECLGSSEDYDDYITHVGAGYPDYLNNSSCRMYRIGLINENDFYIEIGSPAYSCEDGLVLRADRPNMIV